MSTVVWTPSRVVWAILHPVRTYRHLKAVGSQWEPPL